MSIWATILVAVISSASALIAVFLSNIANEKRLITQAQLERDRDIEKLKLQKAEELYLSLTQLKLTVFKCHMDWVSLAKREISFSELAEKTNKLYGENSISTLQAKLGIYFPSLLNEFEIKRELLKPANDSYFRLAKGEVETESERQKIVQIILNSGTRFDKAIDELLIKLSHSVDITKT